MESIIIVAVSGIISLFLFVRYQMKAERQRNFLLGKAFFDSGDIEQARLFLKKAKPLGWFQIEFLYLKCIAWYEDTLDDAIKYSEYVKKFARKDFEREDLRDFINWLYRRKVNKKVQPFIKKCLNSDDPEWSDQISAEYIEALRGVLKRPLHEISEALVNIKDENSLRKHDALVLSKLISETEREIKQSLMFDGDSNYNFT